MSVTRWSSCTRCRREDCPRTLQIVPYVTDNLSDSLIPLAKATLWFSGRQASSTMVCVICCFLHISCGHLFHESCIRSTASIHADLSSGSDLFCPLCNNRASSKKPSNDNNKPSLSRKMTLVSYNMLNTSNCNCSYYPGKERYVHSCSTKTKAGTYIFTCLFSIYQYL